MTTQEKDHGIFPISVRWPLDKKLHTIWRQQTRAPMQKVVNKEPGGDQVFSFNMIPA